MRHFVFRSLAAGAIGVILAFTIAPAQAKTLAECNADYAANQAVIKASGGTEAAYLAACTAGSTPAAAEPPASVAPSPDLGATGGPASARGRRGNEPVPTADAPDAPDAPAAPAAAEASPQESNVPITVSSGKLTEIDAYYTLKPDCSSVGYAAVLIKTDVQNGTFSARSGHDRPNLPSDSKLRKCNKRLVPSTQLYYQSTAGYVGDDKLSLELTLASGEKVNVTYNITVK